MPKFKTKKLKAVDIEIVLLWNLCEIHKLRSFSTPEQEEWVHQLFDDCGRKKIRPIDVFDSSIREKDKIWILCQDWVPDKVRHRFAIWCVQRTIKRACKIGWELEQESLDAVRIKRKWLRDKATDKELSDAWHDAGCVAWYKRWSGVWWATYTVANNVAREAAYGTARYATQAAAELAAREVLGSDWDAGHCVEEDVIGDAAYAEERKVHLRWLKREIKKIASK